MKNDEKIENEILPLLGGFGPKLDRPAERRGGHYIEAYGTPSYHTYFCCNCGMYCPPSCQGTNCLFGTSGSPTICPNPRKE